MGDEGMLVMDLGLSGGAVPQIELEHAASEEQRARDHLGTRGEVCGGGAGGRVSIEHRASG